MKRKLKCYLAYTTLLYRIIGVALIPCAFWLVNVGLLWRKYGGILRWGEDAAGTGISVLCFTLSVYVVLYEVFTDYWVLGGCLSDAGKGLWYFRTSHRGASVMGNIVTVDLARRFLFCMIFAVTIFLFSGWKESLVMGLAIYCVIVGILNGSRHFDGFQRNMGIAFLAQVGMTLINVLNYILVEIAGSAMLACLAALYCGIALGVSVLTVRRITGRIRGQKG